MEITIHSQTHYSEGASSIAKAHRLPCHYFLNQIASQLVPIASNRIYLIAVSPFLMHKAEEMFLRRREDVMCASGRTISLPSEPRMQI